MTSKTDRSDPEGSRRGRQSKRQRQRTADVHPDFIPYPVIKRRGEGSVGSPSNGPRANSIPLDSTIVRATENGWRETGNPILAVRAICQRHRAGVFPTEELMEWLVSGLEQWYVNEGNKSLEQYLGLRSPSGHAANKLKEAARIERTQSCLIEVHRLCSLFGLKISDAVAMVVSRLEESEDQTIHFKLEALSDETLQDYYKRWPKDHQTTRMYNEIANDRQVLQSVLVQYPRFAWEHLPELKAYR